MMYTIGQACFHDIPAEASKTPRLSPGNHILITRQPGTAYRNVIKKYANIFSSLTMTQGVIT